eukprot:Hpha_TRINITY_DN8851_c0_g1::TRINITY_DN8851_c0_g1_i1::g.141433::m.141433
MPVSSDEEEPQPQKTVSSDGRFVRTAPPEPRAPEAPLRMPVPHRQYRRSIPDSGKMATGRRSGPDVVLCTAGSKDSDRLDEQLWRSLRMRLEGGEVIDPASLSSDERRVLRGKVALVRGRNPEGPPPGVVSPPPAPPPRKDPPVSARDGRAPASPSGSARPPRDAHDKQLEREAREAAEVQKRREEDRVEWERELNVVQRQQVESEQRLGELLRQSEDAAEAMDGARPVDDVALRLTLKDLESCQQREAALLLQDRRRLCSRQSSEAVGNLARLVQDGEGPSCSERRTASRAGRLVAKWSSVAAVLGSGDETEDARAAVLLLDLDADGVVSSGDLRKCLCVLTGDQGWTNRHAAQLLRRSAGSEVVGPEGLLSTPGASLRDALQEAVQVASRSSKELFRSAEKKRQEADEAKRREKRSRTRLQRRYQRLQRELLQPSSGGSGESPHQFASQLQRRKELLAEAEKVQQALEELKDDAPMLNPIEERALRSVQSGRRQQALLKEAAAHNKLPGSTPLQVSVHAARARIRWCKAQGLPPPKGLTIDMTGGRVSPPAREEYLERVQRAKACVDTGQFGPRVPPRVTVCAAESESGEQCSEAAAVVCGVYEVMAERFNGQPMWGSEKARLFRGGDGRWTVAVRDAETGRFDTAFLQTEHIVEWPFDGGGTLQRFDAEQGKWVPAMLRISSSRRALGEGLSPRAPPPRRPDRTPGAIDPREGVRLYSPTKPADAPLKAAAMTPTEAAAVGALQRLRTEHAKPRLVERSGNFGSSSPPRQPLQPRQPPRDGTAPRAVPLLSSALRHCVPPEESVNDPLRQALARAHRSDRLTDDPRNYIPNLPAFSFYN